LARTTDDAGLAAAWADAYVQDHVKLDVEDFAWMQQAAVRMYKDFDPGFVLNMLDLYLAIDSRKKALALVYEKDDAGDVLVMLDREEDCAEYAFGVFDAPMPGTYRDHSAETLRLIAGELQIPTFTVEGRNSDFRKRGIWFGAGHCWAVVSMTEVTRRNLELQYDDYSARLRSDVDAGSEPVV